MLVNYLINPSHYKEEKIIGEGKFGSVSLVHSKSNCKYKIALKEIPADLNEKDSQKYFIREVLVMAELNHPSLIKMIGFSLPSKNDLFFKIYSEYIPNGTLLNALCRDELADESSIILTPTIRSKIIYGIASAMEYLHKQKIIHRDLKPENIFLDKENHPIISDFGLSRFCTNDLMMTKKLGTPYYMAPELFSDDSDTNIPITNKIDVYAFGMTLLTMFSTTFSFSGRKPRTISQLLRYILSGKRYIIPNDVPEFYSDLIQKCWLNNALERPSFEQIVKLFDQSDDFMIHGSDIEEVHKFMISMKIYEINSKMNESCKFDSSSSLSDNESDQEETKEFDFGLF